MPSSRRSAWLAAPSGSSWPTRTAASGPSRASSAAARARPNLRRPWPRQTGHRRGRGVAAGADRGRRVAGPNAIVVSGAAGRAALRHPGHPSRPGRQPRTDHAGAGCRGGLRVGRARVDPGLPARVGARGVPAAAPRARPRLWLRHPGHGGGEAARTPVLATDIDPLVRAGGAGECRRERAAQPSATAAVATGWQPAARRAAPYDLVFANILARPLCAMAQELAANLAPAARRSWPDC